MYKSIKITQNLSEIFQSHPFLQATLFFIRILENIADGHFGK